MIIKNRPCNQGEWGVCVLSFPGDRSVGEGGRRVDRCLAESGILQKLLVSRCLSASLRQNNSLQIFRRLCC